jgi:hypothetical protein
MWYRLDPELERQLKHIRQMVKLRQETPTKEWPLVFVDEFGAMLVVREWPGGEITAYTISKDASDRKEER